MTVIGEMWVPDYDLGVSATLGARLFSHEVDGDIRSTYVVDIPGFPTDLVQFDNAVPVQWIEPEDVFQPHILPSISIRRSDPEPNFEGKSWYGMAAAKPADTAVAVVDPVTGLSGFDKYENQWRPTPFRIPYEVYFAARLERQIMFMLRHALRHFEQPFFSLKTFDSLGEQRNYDAGPVASSRVSELANIAERMSAYMVTFEVHAELDLHDTFETFALTQPPETTYNQTE